MQHNFKYSLYSFLILLSSVIYFGLAYIGYSEGSLTLEEGTSLTGTVNDIGITERKNSKGSSKVCFLHISGEKQILGVYRKSKDYDNILQAVAIGNQVTIYYRPNTYDDINIDVMQIETNRNIVYSYEEYRNKEFSLVYIGLIGGIATVIGAIYYFRKHVLRKKSR